MSSDTPLENEEAYFDDAGPNDVEEGELPEEGEIMDDEEDERPPADNKGSFSVGILGAFPHPKLLDASSSHRKSTSSTKSTEKTVSSIP